VGRARGDLADEVGSLGIGASRRRRMEARPFPARWKEGRKVRVVELLLSMAMVMGRGLEIGRVHGKEKVRVRGRSYGRVAALAEELVETLVGAGM
jgi:hypothetical protein